MRKAGLQQTNPGDPRLLTLLEQGATEAEFVGIAAEAVGKGKGWPWVLAVLTARRSEAAAIALAPRPEDNPDAWVQTHSGIVGRAAELGIDGFDQVRETHEQFRRRVVRAHNASIPAGAST